MKQRKIWNKAIDLGFSLLLLMPVIGVLLALFRNGYSIEDYHSINWGQVFEGYTWVSSLPSFNAILDHFKNAGFVSAGNISYAFFCFGFNALFMTSLRFVFKLFISLVSFADRLNDKLAGGVD